METIHLKQIIQALEKLKKVEELEYEATLLLNQAKELDAIVIGASNSFRFEYDRSTRCIHVYGSITGYEYEVICGSEVENMTVKDLVNRALSNKEYINKALERIADYLIRLANTILAEIAEHKQDP